MLVSRKEAISLMNKWGAERIPFLFAIDFLQKVPFVIPLSQVNPEEILFDIRDFAKNYTTVEILNELPIIKKNPISKTAYANKFENVLSHLHKGNSFLVNLTCKTPIKCNLSLKEIFYASEAKYKFWWKDKFVVFSPECFIKIKNGIISSYPMKGTINASDPDSKNKILNNSKEKAEHYTIVDLIRNDLSMVANEVEVTKFRYIDEIITEKGKLLQVSSQIEGKLSDDYLSHLGDIIFALLPAGSISGAPKNKTVEIILETEQYDRNYYTGIFGVFDGNNIDSGVMIRFIEKAFDGLVYKSGGGITASSNIEDEYNEIINKIYVPINRKH